MNDDPPIVVLGNSHISTKHQPQYISIKDSKIHISGEPIHLQIGIRNLQATLMDIIPLARALSLEMRAIVQEQSLRAGITITCTKGCSMCCRHWIPLSIPEAIYLAEQTMRMSPRRCAEIKRRSMEISNRAEQAFPEFLGKNNIRNLLDIYKIGRWFQGLGLNCPFLENHLCTIYEYRPGTCSEWFVSGKAQDCHNGTLDINKVVQIPISMTVILTQLTAFLQQHKEEIIPLYLMFNCHENNSDLLNKTWPTTYLIDMYITTVIRLRNETRKYQSPMHRCIVS